MSQPEGISFLLSDSPRQIKEQSVNSGELRLEFPDSSYSGVFFGEQLNMLPAHFHDVYLRSYLVKNTAGAHKEPSKKYKNNLRTLKSRSYDQCRPKHKYYNNKVPHFLTAGLQIFSI